MHLAGAGCIRVIHVCTSYLLRYLNFRCARCTRVLYEVKLASSHVFDLVSAQLFKKQKKNIPHDSFIVRAICKYIEARAGFLG